jgi:hypothetical protein
VPKDAVVAMAIILGIFLLLFVAGRMFVYLKGVLARHHQGHSADEESHVCLCARRSHHLLPPLLAAVVPLCCGGCSDDGLSAGCRQRLQHSTSTSPAIPHSCQQPAISLHQIPPSLHMYELPARSPRRASAGKGGGVSASPALVEGYTSHTVIHPNGDSVTKLLPPANGVQRRSSLPTSVAVDHADHGRGQDVPKTVRSTAINNLDTPSRLVKTQGPPQMTLVGDSITGSSGPRLGSIPRKSSGVYGCVSGQTVGDPGGRSGVGDGLGLSNGHSRTTEMTMVMDAPRLGIGVEGRRR